MAELDPVLQNPFTAPLNAEAARLAEAPPKPVARVEGTKPGPNQFDMTPQARFAEQQREQRHKDPFLDHSLVMKRDDKGVVSFHERVVDPKTGAVTAGRVVTGNGETGAPADGQTPPKPDGEQKFKFGETELSESEIRDLLVSKAETDLRKAQLPATPADYKVELPKDLVLPEGVKFEFDMTNPALEATREWAHRNGLTQVQLSEALGLYASAQAGDQIALSNFIKSQKEALGANGQVRVSAISTWLQGTFGAADAAPFISSLASEAQVRTWEKIIHRWSSQGAGSFGRQGGEPPSNGKVDQKTYDGWTYHQRKEYAERSTLAESRGRR